MEYGYAAPASTAPHGAELIAILIVAGVFVAGVAAAVAVAVRAIRDAQRSLRRCPVCSAVAVRASRCDSSESLFVRVRLQCGQCGTWRRVATTSDEVRRHARRVERDRRRIGDRAVRLAARRTRDDFRAFLAALRADIAGPEDFMAFTRPLPGSPGRRQPGGRER